MLGAAIIAIFGMGLLPARLPIEYDLQAKNLDFEIGNNNGRGNHAEALLLQHSIQGNKFELKHISSIELHALSVKVKNGKGYKEYDEGNYTIRPVLESEAEISIAAASGNKFLIENIKLDGGLIAISNASNKLALRMKSEVATLLLPNAISFTLRNVNIENSESKPILACDGTLSNNIVITLSHARALTVRGQKDKFMTILVDKKQEQNFGLNIKADRAKVINVRMAAEKPTDGRNEVSRGEIRVGSSFGGDFYSLDNHTHYYSKYGVSGKLRASTADDLIQIQHSTNQWQLKLVKGRHAKRIVPSFLQIAVKKNWAQIIAMIYAIFAMYLDLIGGIF